MTNKTYNFNIILNIRPVFSVDINFFKSSIFFRLLNIIFIEFKIKKIVSRGY